MAVQPAIVIRRIAAHESQLRGGELQLEKGQWGFAAADQVLVIRDLEGAFHAIKTEMAMMDSILVKAPAQTTASLPNSDQTGTLRMVLDTNSYWFKTSSNWVQIPNSVSSGFYDDTEIKEQINTLESSMGNKLDKPFGNNTQYINGLGQLVTFPTIPEDWKGANLTVAANTSTNTSSDTAAKTDTLPNLFNWLRQKINGIIAALNGKENAIVAGTASQYWRGDKTWQTLPTGGGSVSFGAVRPLPSSNVDVTSGNQSTAARSDHVHDFYGDEISNGNFNNLTAYGFVKGYFNVNTPDGAGYYSLLNQYFGPTWRISQLAIKNDGSTFIRVRGSDSDATQWLAWKVLGLNFNEGKDVVNVDWVNGRMFVNCPDNVRIVRVRNSQNFGADLYLNVSTRSAYNPITVMFAYGAPSGANMDVHGNNASNAVGSSVQCDHLSQAFIACRGGTYIKGFGGPSDSYHLTKV